MSMETKEEMFIRILQRMKNRRYLEKIHPTKSITGPTKLVNDRIISQRGLLSYDVGDDCWIILAADWEYNLIADRKIIGRNCLIEKGIKVSWGAKFGDGCLFEGNTAFTRDNTFGDFCLFGPGCTFGTGCAFGKDCVFLCDEPTAKTKPTCLKEFRMSGVDGSGREITITIWSDWTVKVKAGCFDGTLYEFCEKARKEKKLFYVNIVEDAANAAVALLKDK